jgi:hypothetical protein
MFVSWLNVKNEPSDQVFKISLPYLDPGSPLARHLFMIYGNYSYYCTIPKGYSQFRVFKLTPNAPFVNTDITNTFPNDQHCTSQQLVHLVDLMDWPMGVSAGCLNSSVVSLLGPIPFFTSIQSLLFSSRTSKNRIRRQSTVLGIYYKTKPSQEKQKHKVYQPVT